MTMQPAFSVWRVSLLSLLAVIAACTNADIYHPKEIEISVFDNKLRLSGKFCTSDPSDVVFPLKVLFVIDTSQSMNNNDPISQTEPDPTKQTGRARAIRDVIAQYINLKSSFQPKYCNTGIGGCAKYSTTTCPDCGAGFMCAGPDCCIVPPGKTAAEVCKGVPVCPPTTGANKGVNAACIPLCDTKKAGCGPTETSCPDCPDVGDKCLASQTNGNLGGLCGNHKDPGVEFAIMRFGSAKQVLTKNLDGLDGFTNDVVELVSSIPQVSNGGSVTDYEGALSTAYKVISDDINSMVKKNAAAVNRSKYVVVFLSDGEPYPRVNDEDDWTTVPDYLQKDLLGQGFTTTAVQEYNIPNRILQRAKEIMSIKTLYRLGDIRIHTAFLAGNNPSWVEDEATYLLKQIAQIGKGTFRSFPNGEDINFLHVGFSSMKRVFRMKNFIATNLSARPFAGNQLRDSDADGLEDGEEVQAGTDLSMVDTDGDGFSDLLEHFYRSSGWDALDPSDADCPLLNDVDGDRLPDDTDGDGLKDCEERILGTNRNLFDSDADGIPDGIEVRFGTNPVVVDTEDDLDFDGMPNGDEIRLHTDPRSDDAAHRSRISYRYDIQKVGTGVEVVGLGCVVDADCPSSQLCKEKHCRCTTDDSCSSNKTCQADAECSVVGEKCLNKKCVGKWGCAAPNTIDLKDPLKEADNVCTAKKNITCYEFDVENISLVTPKFTAAAGESGWNQVQLYFGEVPFDNPGDFGNFTMACVNVWYNDQNGSKLPATGKLVVPETAWKSPKLFNRTYVATVTDNTAGDRRECGADPATKAKLYCSTDDECADPDRRRCKVSMCVCPSGSVGICR